MGTFLDTLSDLNRQGFGQGLALYGKALSMQRDNERLAEGVRRFNEKKRILDGEQLPTTGEQLADIQSIPTGEKTMEEKLADMANNLHSIHDSIGAYQNLYQPFITAFATLGDDGIKVANSLSKQLGDKIQSLENKANMPIVMSEYANTVMENGKSYMVYHQMQEDAARKKSIMTVQQAIVDNKDMSFWKIPAHPQNVIANSAFGQKAIKEYDRNIKETVNVLQGMFPEMDKNVISEAVTRMATGYGMSLVSHQEKPDATLAALNAKQKIQLQADVNKALFVARDFTDEFNNLGVDMKEAAKQYYLNGTLKKETKKDKDGNEYEVAVFQDVMGKPLEVPWTRMQQLLVKMADYEWSRGVLSAHFGDKWNEVKTKELNGQTYTEASIYPEIMRIPYASAYLNQEYTHNPYQKKSLIKKQTQMIDKMMHTPLGNLYNNSNSKKPDKEKIKQSIDDIIFYSNIKPDQMEKAH